MRIKNVSEKRLYLIAVAIITTVFMSILIAQTTNAQMGFVNSPENNGVYTLGSPVEIDIQPTGSVGVGGISISGSLTIQSGSVTKLSKTVSASGSPAHIRESYTPDQTGTYTMTVNLSYTLSGIPVDSSTYTVTFQVQGTGNGGSDSNQGNNSSGSAVQPDSNCHYDVVPDEDNSSYYIDLKEYEYTIDLNSNNVAHIDYTLTSYDSSDIHFSYWLQTGDEKYIKETKNQKPTISKKESGEYVGSGYVEFSGAAVGTAVVEMYNQVVEEVGAHWYDRKFVKIHVIDSSKDAKTTTNTTTATAASTTTATATSTTGGETASTPASAKTTVKAKKANTMTVKTNKVTVSLKTLKKKNVTVKAKKAFTVKKAIGKVTYKKVSGSKKITVSKTGKITVKKGLKKGKYTIKVKVTAKGNNSYKSKSKTVKLTVTVK